MVKRAHEGRNNQFFFQNIKNEIFKIFNMKKTTWNSPEQPVESNQKLATGKTAPHS